MRYSVKRRDFLKAGIGGAFTLWGITNALQEEKALAANGREPLPQGRKVDMHAHAILPSPARLRRQMTMQVI